MKFEKSYKVTVEIYDDKIDQMLEWCGETRESAIEEWGSVEEWLAGYAEESIVCHVDWDEEYIKDWVIEDTDIKKVED